MKFKNQWENIGSKQESCEITENERGVLLLPHAQKNRDGSKQKSLEIVRNSLTLVRGVYKSTKLIKKQHKRTKSNKNV